MHTSATDMQNPWMALREFPDWVLPDDAPRIASFNARNAATERADVRYRLDLFPEPYFGSPDSEFMLLALNPGATEEDAAWHARPVFIEAARRSLVHQLAPLPFLHLQQPRENPGGKWWRRITAPLQGRSESRIAALARTVFCVQWFPYHSTRFASGDLTVPSQAYSFALVQQAITQKRPVIFLRSRQRWERSVPELASYERARAIKNFRNPTSGRVIKWIGVGMTLAILPIMSIIGFGVLGMYTSLSLFVAFNVLRRAGNYAFANPGREVLFTVIPPEDKYKAKNFIATFVYRSGDQIGAWSYAGLSALGLAVSSISLMAVPMSAVWLAVALRLGRRHTAMQLAESAETEAHRR